MSHRGIGAESGQQYSPGVLVGNWYEERCAKEDQLKLYQKQKQSATQTCTASFATASFATASFSAAAGTGAMGFLTQPVSLAAESSGPVPVAQPLLLLHKKTGAALAVDTSSMGPGGGNQGLLSAVPGASPQRRTAWLLERCTDENNGAFQHTVASFSSLHYGQRVRIANEHASDHGFLYVHSELAAGVYSSQKQRAAVRFGADADSVFVISRPFHRRGGVDDGDAVEFGDPVVLLHSITNRPLCIDGSRQRTAFGMEYGVTCGYVQPTASRSRSAVVTSDENVFTFSVDTTAGPYMMSTRSRTASSSVGAAAKDDVAEEVLARLRGGAADLGGRVGFRAFSKALGVACNERRRTMLNRGQFHQLVQRLGVVLQPEEVDVVMKVLDRSGNNVICAQDLLDLLRGNMSTTRLQAVVDAFQQLVVEGDGSVDFADLFNLFRENAQNLPDVVDGLCTREEAVRDFESCWPGRIGSKLGTVTLEEFVDYYTDLSPAVDDDDRFVETVQHSWAIPVTDAYRSGRPLRSLTVVHTNDTCEVIGVPDSLLLDTADGTAVRRFLTQHGVRDVKDFSVSKRM